MFDGMKNIFNAYLYVPGILQVCRIHKSTKYPDLINLSTLEKSLRSDPM
jgi:hypothetical protein